MSGLALGIRVVALGKPETRFCLFGLIPDNNPIQPIKLLTRLPGDLCA